MNEENIVETGKDAGAAATNAVSLVKIIIPISVILILIKMAFFKIILTQNVKMNKEKILFSPITFLSDFIQNVRIILQGISRSVVYNS